MKVALTFDTEPTPSGHDPRNAETVLDVLKAAGVRATFFVQGEWAEHNPELARRLTAEGHRVGNHTYSHALPGRISASELRNEIERGDEAIRRATGQDPRPLFRCPQNSGAFDGAVLDRLERAGYRQVGWTFDTFDWQDGCTAEELEATVLRGVEGNPSGAVVLLHSWPDATAHALPRILDVLLADGVEFVYVDELVDCERTDGESEAAVVPVASHHLGKSTLWGLAAKFTTIASNFLIGVIIARALGPVGKGAYSLVLQIVGVLVVVLGLGLNTSNVYFVGRRMLSPRTATANSIWLLAVTGAIATGVCLLFIAGPFAPEPPYSLAMAVAASALFVVTTLFSWLGAIAVGMSGLRPQAIAGIGSVIVVLSGAFVLQQLGVLSALFVVGLGIVGQLVAVLAVLVQERGRMLSLKPSMSAFRRMVGYSAKSYVVDLVGYLHLRLDILLLGWLAGAATVGVYSVAVSFAEIARYVPSVLGSALFARASQVGAADSTKLSARVSRLTVLLVVASAATFAVAGPFLIPIVFGDAFAKAGPILLVLLPGMIFMSASEVPSSYLFSREVIYWRTSAVLVALNVAINVVTIPRFGALGAAMASTATYSLLALVIFHLMKRHSALSYRELIVPTAEDVRLAVGVLGGYARSAVRMARARLGR